MTSVQEKYTSYVVGLKTGQQIVYMRLDYI